MLPKTYIKEQHSQYLHLNTAFTGYAEDCGPDKMLYIQLVHQTPVLFHTVLQQF